MDIHGEYFIPADRVTVWQALNDPIMLRDCIPGCRELTTSDDGQGFDATVVAKIGPVKATFKGGVILQDVVEGESYTIVGEGKGGTAGFARMKSRVNLDATDDGGTRLRYSAEAQLGGKLAQLGSRLIQGTARKYADDFFGTLTARLSPQVGVTEEADVPASPQKTDRAGEEAGGGNNWLLYGAVAAVVLVIIGLMAL